MTPVELETLEFESGPRPGASVIVLHGLGADGNDFVPICEALDLNPLIGLANTYAGPWQMLAERLLRPVAGDQTTAILSRLLAGGGNG